MGSTQRSAVSALSLAALIGVGVVLQGCSSSGNNNATSNTGAATKTPYQMGFIGGLTGATAAYDGSLLSGAEAYFSTVNDHGGVDGHPIKTQSVDDANVDIGTATADYINLKNSIHPFAIMGLESSVADVLIKQAQADKIPLLTANPDTTFLASPYGFAVSSLFSEDGQAEMSYLASLVHGQTPKIALLTSASSASAAAQAAVTKQIIQQKGWDLAYSTIYPLPPPTDMSSYAQQIVNSGATYVVGGLYGNLEELLGQSLATLGWHGTLINNSGGSDLKSLQAMGQILGTNYAAVRYVGYPSNLQSDVQKMDSAVTASGGSTTGPYILQGWIAGALITKALTSCGFPCSGSKMKSALEHTGPISLPGVTVAPVQYSSTQRELFTNAAVFVEQTGGPKQVFGPVKVSAS